MVHTRRRCVPALALALLLASCGGDPAAMSGDPDVGSDTSAVPAVSAAVETTDQTVDSTSSSISTESNDVTTSDADAPSTTVAQPPEVIEEETFLADVDGRVMRIAVSDGKGVDIIDDFSEGGGVFVAGMEDVGGTEPGAYISVAFEDYWYSCDSQPGLVWWYPTGGEREPVDRGIGAKISPDGTKLAFLASTECEESTIMPGEFVAHIDTVVLFDRLTGEKRRVRWSAAVMGTDDSQIGSLAWSADSSAVYLSRQKDVRRLSLDGRDLSSAEIVWKYETDDNVSAWLVGHRADNGRLLFHEASSSGGNTVGRTVEIDTLTAVRKSTPWTADYRDTSLDQQGTRVLRLVGDNTVEVDDGEEVGTIEIDDFVVSVDW